MIARIILLLVGLFFLSVMYWIYGDYINSGLFDIVQWINQNVLPFVDPVSVFLLIYFIFVFVLKWNQDKHISN